MIKLPIFTQSETEYCLTLSIKKPSMRYANEFLKTYCSADMIRLKLFPNFKEITETFAVFNAVRKHLWKVYPPDRSDVSLIVVGDGNTPRTAATFAFRTKWDCIAIDPQLKNLENWLEIKRLTCISEKIERYFPLVSIGSEVILVAVHSHVPLQTAYDKIRDILYRGRISVVTIPCCVEQSLKFDGSEYYPDFEYEDWGIWSPERTVKVWMPGKMDINSGGL